MKPLITKKRLIIYNSDFPADVIRRIVGYVAGTEDGVEIMAKDCDKDVITTCNCSGIPVRVFCANQRAYLERDKHMAEQSDEVIAFWDGRSGGIKYAFTVAIEMQKPTIVYRFCGTELVETRLYEPHGYDTTITPRQIYGRSSSVLR